MISSGKQKCDPKQLAAFNGKPVRGPGIATWPQPLAHRAPDAIKTTSTQNNHNKHNKRNPKGAKQQQRRPQGVAAGSNIALRALGAESGGRVQQAPYVNHSATIGKSRNNVANVYLYKDLSAALGDNSLQMAYVGSRKVHGKSGMEMEFSVITCQVADGKVSRITILLTATDFDTAKAEAIAGGWMSDGKPATAEGPGHVKHSDGTTIFMLSHMEMMASTVTIVKLTAEGIPQYQKALRVWGMGQSVLIPIPNDKSDTIRTAFGEATAYLAHLGRCGTSIRNKGEQYAHWHLDAQGNLSFAGKDDVNKTAIMGQTAEAEALITTAWATKMEAVKLAKDKRRLAADGAPSPKAKSSEWTKVTDGAKVVEAKTQVKAHAKAPTNGFAVLTTSSGEESGSEDEVDPTVTPAKAPAKQKKQSESKQAVRNRKRREAKAARKAEEARKTEEKAKTAAAKPKVESDTEDQTALIARLQAQLAQLVAARETEPESDHEEEHKPESDHEEEHQPDEFPTLGAAVKAKPQKLDWSIIASHQPRQTPKTEEVEEDESEPESEDEVGDVMAKIKAVKAAKTPESKGVSPKKLNDAQEKARLAQLAAKEKRDKSPEGKAARKANGKEKKQKSKAEKSKAMATSERQAKQDAKQRTGKDKKNKRGKSP